MTGTGAIPLSQQDNVGDSDVILEAEQNKLINAATVTNGELSVDLRAANITADGLSPGSQLNSVFQIRNKGNESVEVFIESSPDDIEFVDESGSPFQTSETAVSLGPNESVSVGLKLLETATPGTQINGTVTVTVLSPEATETGSGGSAAAASDLEDDRFDGQSVLVNLNPDGADAAASVRNLEGGENATVDLQEAVVTSRVSYNELFVAVENDTDTVELQANALSEPPENEPAGLAGNNTAISYLQVEPTASDVQVSDGSISEARIDFTVSESVFRDRPLDRNDPQLYRFNDTIAEWVPLRTERVDARSYRAFGPNFSVFAVGYPVQPEFQVVETTLVDPEVEADQPVAVAVEVTNTGTGPGEFQTTLDAGQPTTVSETVRIAPDSTERVVLEQSVPVLGTYDVEVNNQPVGAVTVSETVTESSTPTPTPTETPSSTEMATPTDAGETQDRKSVV